MKTQKMKNRSIVMGVAVAILALLTFTHEVHAQNEKTSTSISVSRGVHTISHSNAQGRLNLEYEGNSDFNVEAGERSSTMYLFRPTWSQNSDFARERNDVLEEKRDKIRELQEERRRL